MPIMPEGSKGRHAPPVQIIKLTEKYCGDWPHVWSGSKFRSWSRANRAARQSAKRFGSFCNLRHIARA